MHDWYTANKERARKNSRNWTAKIETALMLDAANYEKKILKP